MVNGYKGFDKDLKCRGFQYKVGEEYEEKEAKICNSGFHFCEFPLDVFKYYEPASNRFATVSTNEKVYGDNDDSKKCSRKIKINAEIGLPGIIKAGVEFIFNKVDWKNNKESNTGNRSAATNTGYQSAATNTGYQSAATNTGDQSAATNTGNQSAATNTGNRSAATNTGDQSAATNTGDQSAATNTGDQSAATNTGNQSAATNTGYQSAATNTGYQSAATNTGNRSAATNTGNQSAATTEGKESVSISLGIEGRAKGIKGSWIVLSEWEKDSSYEWHRKTVKSFKIDGKNIKENTFYILENNKAVEYKEGE